MPSRWSTATLVSAAALLTGAAAPAAAEIVARTDGAGRPITFDLQAAGVDVDGYARLLSGSLHGAEISSVVVRVIPPAAIATECGAGAAACYERDGRGSRITVPAGSPAAVRDSLVHEYGHHVDASVRHQAASCSDGTRRWWAARDAAALLATGLLRCDYAAGWDRSVAEVFAEDYRVLNVQGATSRGALGQPSAPVLDALRQDLVELDLPAPLPPPNAPPEPVPPPDPPGAGTGTRGVQEVPVLGRGSRLSRSGRLAAGGVTTIRFRLTRRQRVALTVRRLGVRPGDFVVELRCGRGAKLVGDGRRVGSVGLGGRLGPGRCSATIRAGRRGLEFGLRLRVPR